MYVRVLSGLTLVNPLQGVPMSPSRYHGGATVHWEQQPKYCFCGHIHEGAGSEGKVGETTVINVGKPGYLLEVQ